MRPIRQTLSLALLISLVAVSQPDVNAAPDSNAAIAVSREGLRNAKMSDSAQFTELNGKTYLRGSVQKRNCDNSTFGFSPQSPVADENSNRTLDSISAGPDDTNIPIIVSAHESIFLPDETSSCWIALDQLFERVSLPAVEASGRGRQKYSKEIAANKGKSMLNYMLGYRAFGPSAEAADLILGEHSRSKSPDAKKYYLQQKLDQGHLLVVSHILQLGAGLGMPESIDGKRMSDASLASLRTLVGYNETDEIMEILKSVRLSQGMSGAIGSHGLWTLSERDGKVQKIVQSALACDPVVIELKNSLHRYNRHGKVLLRSMGALQTALHVAAFTPTFAAPAAEAASFILVMSTGGPEQDKLLREMYLSKCLDSRTRMITDKAKMVVEAYNEALMANNSLLLASAQSVVRQMSGEEMVKEVFGSSELATRAGLGMEGIRSSKYIKSTNSVAQLGGVNYSSVTSSQVVPRRNPAL